MNEKIKFFLPLGIIYNGKLCREGSMHPVTTGDELEVQTAEESGFNPRWRDILLLSRVIDEIEGIGKLSPQMMEELYEADFLYLQLLYREINTDTRVFTNCTKCHAELPVNLTQVYRNMDVYQDGRR